MEKFFLSFEKKDSGIKNIPIEWIPAEHNIIKGNNLIIKIILNIYLFTSLTYGTFLNLINKNILNKFLLKHHNNFYNHKQCLLLMFLIFQIQVISLFLIHQNENDHGGFRNITFEVKGANAYGMLKNESGVHRLVRIPPAPDGIWQPAPREVKQ